MIVRLLIEGLVALSRPVSAATLRGPAPRTRTGRGRRSRPAPTFRGRPDLMLLTGAMTAPSALPHRAVRGRTVTVPGLGRRTAA
ncbi:hypothetical protein [Roseospira navarrensis]|uniref:Uncharacterized protein n=1 Tax=Roseospira navarrensis TaxID=140058 RepID=A0A7X1ZGE0_9PROT|nr:hypothetical protein [Roseospira navarrensis]MQX37534.1 hypothetical protein [Roseospira navarrensis]